MTNSNHIGFHQLLKQHLHFPGKLQLRNDILFLLAARTIVAMLIDTVLRHEMHVVSLIQTTTADIPVIPFLNLI